MFLLSFCHILLAQLFIKTNSSWLITESIKALEIKTSLLFNSDFGNNTILSCFFFYFWIIDLFFLIPAITVQIFNHVAGLVNPIGIPSKEAKAEIETHPIIVEAKIRKCSI